MRKNFIMILFLFSIEVFANNNIRIVSSEEAPTNYTENEKFIGIMVDIVNILSKMTDTKATIEVNNWNRSYNIAEKWSLILDIPLVYISGEGIQIK